MRTGGPRPIKNEIKAPARPRLQWVEDFAADAAERRFGKSVRDENDKRFTQCGFKIYPDGGVARLRLYGEVVPDAARTSRARDRSRRGRKWRAGDFRAINFIGAPLNISDAGAHEKIWATDGKHAAARARTRLGDCQAGRPGRSGAWKWIRRISREIFRIAVRLRLATPKAGREISARDGELARIACLERAQGEPSAIFSSETERCRRGDACAVEYLS